MKVLVVDDSIVFRSAIRQAIDGQQGIEVVGTALHGQQAIDKLKDNLKVDLITLDLEMPVLDGISTIREIRKLGLNLPIIVFSAYSQAGAEKTMEALTAGAQDFLPKVSEDDTAGDNAIETLRKILLPKLVQFKGMMTRPVEHQSQPAPRPSVVPKVKLDSFSPDVIHIGSSTGGPEALKLLFSQWTNKPGVPVLLTQHMPPLFTKQMANLLNRICPALTIKEAEQGEVILNDHVYVAPGDYHMEVRKEGDVNCISLTQTEKVNSVRPAVDVMIDSSDFIYKKSINVILTGMGEDGLAACKKQKNKSNPILIQDKESCVVFGMPGAIARAELQDYMGNINEIIQLINKRWA
ncbi:MAG: chemotaxis-specific protein-glutamate methyltransferase CheB [Bdellovibrionota bacterium]|nr:chemotaxis-specific protein-glutamate methyltransferase CheB [Bdellovibrionota bacterium]